MFTNKNIFIANVEDCAAITALLNKSYRGETSKQGWTTEADLIDGEVRANNDMVIQAMNIKGSVILKYIYNNIIAGCVNLQEKDNKLYLGMFSVEPILQGSGIGKKILLAAEEYAEYKNCKSIYMTVISLRTELIEWYKRHGYSNTFQTIPFKEDGLSGKHKQPLEFVVLEKPLP